MEILQNSILKLIVRQGSDSDRKSVILDSGELGYTVDTYRLFIGDGFLSGGNITGNLFRGIAPTITNASLWPSIKGDMAFASDSNKLYTVTSGVGNTLSSWTLIGGVYSSGSPEISISSNNTITLNTLSANSISNDALSTPLTLSGGRIRLSPLSSGHISNDAISPPLSIVGGKVTLLPLSANYISTNAVMSPLTIIGGKIGLVALSAGYISENAIELPLIINDGKLGLSNVPINKVSTTTFTITDGLDVLVNGVDANNTSFYPLSSNVILKSNQIYAKYHGLSGDSLIFSKKILEVTRFSTGYYRFSFNPPLNSDEYIPIAQIIGTDALTFQPRVVEQTNEYCDIKILNSNATLTDANLNLIINY